MPRTDPRIKKRITADGRAVWDFCLKLRLPSGATKQVRRRGFATYAEAEAAFREAQEARRSLVEGRTTPAELEDRNVTVEAFLRRWLAAISAGNPNTVGQYRWALETHVIPALGGVRLQALRGDDVGALYAGLLSVSGKPLSGRSRQAVHKALHAALAQARRSRVIAFNPCDDLPIQARPRSDTREMRTWDEEAAARFTREAVGNPLYGAWTLMLHRGMRREEVAGLRWSDVDLERGQLTVANVRTQLAGTVHEGEPKTKGSRRVVALGDDLSTVLRRLAVEQKRWELAAPAWASTGYVFVWPKATRGQAAGSPVNPEVITRHFGALIDKLGLPKIRLYDLRHSAATLMLLQGVHVKVVSEMIGHSRTSTTWDTYAHTQEAMHAEAGDELTRRLMGESR